MHTVKKDGYMEQYTQMIGKNVYTVKGKIGYLIVRKKNSLSVFYCIFVSGNCGIILNGMIYYLCCLERQIGICVLRKGENIWISLSLKKV